ncbi:hypothetical protein ABTZ44_17005 [Microbacterium oxydans]|uniref:hypothetical protein n=1 Tax=Microbacterium TaxID=33882 RepID=UPI00187D478E|nr:hypothetical protein [Microbacterium sp. R1]MBE7956296.1 hypothetical protein [Microbacterium sp. R1]
MLNVDPGKREDCGGWVQPTRSDSQRLDREGTRTHFTADRGRVKVHELQESEQLDELLGALGNLQTELDAYTRIVAAYAMRDQKYTLLEAATRLNTGKSTLSRWRLHTIALDGRYRAE